MDKTVVITGGTRGIGKATADLFRENGWNVIAVGSEGYKGVITNWQALVNCAGIHKKLKNAKEHMDINYYLTVHWCMRALEEMVGGGHIVNVGSMCAIPSEPVSRCTWDYVASKYAVHGFTKAFAVDTMPFGIKVNCIAPGGVDTDMFRESGGENPKYKPEDIAKAIYELCLSDKTGQIVEMK